MTKFCNDCGMDTEPWPPHRGTQEQYIVKDDVWASARMPRGKMREDDQAIVGGGGFLCVGCIEKRLGRLLTIDDFVPITLELLKGCENTPRLLSRVGVNFMDIANDPLPDHIVDRWLEVTLENATEGHRPRVLKVKVDGDEVVVVYKKEALRYRAGPGLKALMAMLRMDRMPEGGANIDLLAWAD